jgi:predicted Rossmann fold nucleotide-binding protein DprA/Smf involved in DNA uptake
MSAELVQLAERLVELNQETAEVRSGMLKLLANGADPAPHPTSRPHKGLKQSPSPEAMARAGEAEAQIVEMLKTEPLGPAEIARRTQAKVGTVNDRLKRLAGRGLVERRDEGWTAISPP